MGRFGYLNPDDQVDLRLDEEICVMENGGFEPLTEQPLPDKIIPLRARFIYDLRNVDWSHRHAASHLRELSRHTLLNLLVAMNELGVSVDAFESMPVDDIVDNIRRAARAHGWDTLSHGERLACPAASDEDTNEEDEGGDSEPNGEGDKEPQGEKATEEEDKEPSADSEEDAEEDKGGEDDKEQPSEETPAAATGPARKRPAAKKAAKPSKP